MKFCDITLAYNEASGGIRTYIDQRRQYLLDQTEHEHILIVPAPEDGVERDGRSTTYYVSSPLIPGHAPYRSFWRPGPITSILNDCRPDAIELGSFYVSPWPCFSYRQREKKRNHPVILGAYFHTDVARALVQGPLEQFFSQNVGEWSETLESLGLEFAKFVSSGAESYIESVFRQCDLRLAASHVQVERLKQYGIRQAHVVPLGCDLNLFHPDKRSEDVRVSFDIKPDQTALIYGGRLNEEKDVTLLIEAYRKLPDRDDFHLLIFGEGPLNDKLSLMSEDLPHVRILPFESDAERFAKLMASADIYITAGPYETFGLSVAEAEASGLPVVGVDAGALPERVASDVGRLGPVNDAPTFAENILEVRSNHSRLAQQARQRAEREYCWKSTFKRAHQLYESELNQLQQKYLSPQTQTH